jgi:hypothetical protein
MKENCSDRKLDIHSSISTLFTDHISNSVCTGPRHWMKVSNEFYRVWGEVSVAQFRVLAQHLYRGSEENYEECEDSHRPYLAPNREASDYKSGALEVEPKRRKKRVRKMEKAESKRA